MGFWSQMLLSAFGVLLYFTLHDRYRFSHRYFDRGTGLCFFQSCPTIHPYSIINAFKEVSRNLSPKHLDTIHFGLVRGFGCQEGQSPSFPAEKEKVPRYRASMLLKRFEETYLPKVLIQSTPALCGGLVVKNAKALLSRQR
jgi:hypothetical protein